MVAAASPPAAANSPADANSPDDASLLALTATQIRGHHLLATPALVAPKDLRTLAQTRWPGALLRDDGTLQLSRYSWLAKPLSLAFSLARWLGLTADLHFVYLVNTLTERGDPPFPGSLDPTGIARAFPDALPVREEERVLEWLVAVARRLGGALRFDPSGLVVRPDRYAAIDLTLYSDRWLDPVWLNDLVKGIHPAFRLATALTEWAGPVNQHDLAALAAPPTLDGYAAQADLGPGGRVIIEVSALPQPPVGLRGLVWAGEGVVSYALHWIPVVPEQLLVELPDPTHQAAQRTAAGLLMQLATALRQVVGGVLLDQDGFVAVS
ncbi:MAG: hypothetical protein LBG70_01900 [Bifidobacteriaceae bacterium]|jgi:hypothetical protein|nr:hypothetical protein [Bifidobacteriaceae bacterium]